MMSAKLDALALKKQRLELYSATLREQIAQDALALQPGLSVADRLMAGVAWLRQHPAVFVAMIAGVAIVRPRRFLRLARRSWWLWLALLRLRSSGSAKVIAKVTGWR